MQPLTEEEFPNQDRVSPGSTEGGKIYVRTPMRLAPGLQRALPRLPLCKPFPSFG